MLSSSRWLILLTLALGVLGCDADDRHTPAPPQDLAAQLQSGDWAVRKLAQRQLWLLGHSDARSDNATRIMDRARQTTARRPLSRLVRAAFMLDREVTIVQLGKITADDAVPLRQRVTMVQAVARDLSGFQVPASFAATARELMANEPTGSESWGIGLRLLGMSAPDEAWPVVQLALTDDGQARRWAVAALSEQKFADALPLLGPLASDADRYVRNKALKALRQYPTAEALVILERVLASDGDNEMCSRALEAVAVMPTQDASRVLGQRLVADDGCGPNHRFAIMAHMRRMLRSEPGLQILTAALRDVVQAPKAPGEDSYAAGAVGDFGLALSFAEAGDVDGLMMLTSASNETQQRRYAAIDALGRLDNMTGTMRLRNMLGRVDQEATDVLRILAALAIHDGLDGDSAFLLVPFTSTGENATLRIAAVETMAKIGTDVRVAARLVDLLGDDEPRVVAAAQAGLTRMRGGKSLGDNSVDWQPMLEQLRQAKSK